MFSEIVALMRSLAEQTGLAQLYWGNLVMIFVGCVLIYLALVKKYEPFLLIGIGFACVVANVPGSDLTKEGGLFYYAYQGVALLVVPPLIFLGVGAMTDFGPMIANPSLVILGAAAHLGIFVALIGAKLIGFTINEAGAIGIIGGADGPMAIYVTMKLAPHLLPQISVAAYSYMALMPLIQPPIMKLLTSKQERSIVMEQTRYVSRLERIAFPIVIAVIVNLLLPPVAPLITMMMLGNLLRETLLVDRLAETVANDVMNVITIVLTVAIGSTMEASRFLNVQTIEIIVLGLIAFMGGTASGVVAAKIMNWLSGGKINPLVGSAGIASVPIAARVSHMVALKDNPYNFLIMHAMGPNLAGVFGTAISGGIMLALLGVR
ncbi:MAG: sodium ion-translocating decarboxylase subunit beta [Negativicutes bacterium]|nr:sodium ion-translocating decarboxylase subunit beta [Negativicutes bacterium]